MSRGRMISKSLGSSRKFHAVLARAGRLGEFAQLLYPLLVVNTDDHGRMAGDAFTVKHLVLPASPRPESAFGSAMDVLADVGLLDRYQVDGVIYLQIHDFEAHQVGLHKRTASRFPEYPGPSGNYREVPSQEKRTEKKRRELKGREEKGTRTVAQSDAPRFSLLEKIAHEAIDLEGANAELSQLGDAVKSLCAIRGIPYDSTSVRKAIDSALIQHRQHA